MAATPARAEPAIRFSAARLFYGNQLVGWRSPAQRLTITNGGSSPLTIHSLSFSGTDPLDFPIARDAAGATLAPGASLDVALQFRPMAAGDRSALLVISDDAPGSPQVVALAGSGVGTYVNRSPRSVDFGGCLIGNAASRTITIRNDWNGPLHISHFDVPPRSFSVDSANLPLSWADPPTTLAPGESTEVTVSYRPTSTSIQNGALYIHDDAPFSPHIVSLSGYGTSPPVPNALTQLTAQLSDTVHPIRLAWTDDTGDETGFQIETQMVNQGWGLPQGPWSATTRAVDLGGWDWYLRTTYSFRVRAVSQYGAASPWSNVVTVDLRSILPAAPRGLAAQWTGDAIRLAWTSSSPGVHGFAVWRRTAASDWTLVYTVADATSFLDTAMTPGVANTYRVRAMRDTTRSDWSSEASVQVPAVPAAPANLSAVLVPSGGVRLTWSGGAGAAAFAIWRQGGGLSDAGWRRVGVTAGSVTTFTDSGLIPGASYAYQVRGIAPGGASGWSNTVNVLAPPAH